MLIWTSRTWDRSPFPEFALFVQSQITSRRADAARSSTRSIDFRFPSPAPVSSYYFIWDMYVRNQSILHAFINLSYLKFPVDQGEKVTPAG